MPRSEKAGLALILAACALPILLGLRWALPGPWHLNTYNCDENTPVSLLQSMDPSRLDFNPVGEKTPNALGEGTFNLYTFAATLKALSVTGALKLTPDKAFYYAHPGEWGRVYLAGRAVSAAYGVLALLAVYLLARAMFGPAAAGLAALLLGLSPAYPVFARFLVMNTPGMFWIVLSLLLLKRLLDTSSPKFYLLAGAAIGFAVSTRYSAGPLVLPYAAAWLLNGRPREDLKPALLGVAVMAAAFLAGTPYALLDYQSFLRGVRAIAGTVAADSGAAGPLGGLAAAAASLRSGLGAGLSAVAAAGLLYSLYRRTKDDLLLAAFVLPMLLIYAKAGAASTEGRMLPVFPFLAVLAARALADAARKLPYAAAAAAALLLAELILYQAAAVRLLLQPDIRDTASAWLEANARPGASIGLLREPSWFSPGVLELDYRHPELGRLRGVRLVPLASGNWAADAGFDLLAKARPDLVAVTSTEAGYLDEAALGAALAAQGYRPAAEFRQEFRRPGFPPARAIPRMLMVQDWVRIYSRKGY